MIGCDWGTTNLRAFRLGDDGRVLERRNGPGLMAVAEGGFAAALREVAGSWLDAGEDRILLAGMVGSRQGWIEAPYLPCPADPATLAAAAVPVPFEGADVRLVPGLSAGGTVPEVMRGEEVQIAGIVDALPDDATVCLPGTHSKWVRVRHGRVEGFTTHMTGEAFAVLRGHTILGRLMRTGAPHDPAAFARGVVRSGEAGGLLHHLFGVRTLGLFGRLTEDEAPSFLSGVLIGHEVRAAAPAGPVYLVGSAELQGLYAEAIPLCGGEAVAGNEDAAAAGLARIGRDVAWTVAHHAVRG